jgi:peptidoglycan/LPS O-acetylase OafA/YrhL
MQSRLYTLDAMRGIAAILVVLYHFNGHGSRPVPGGYLAVDFFFALSGFVLAQAYERPLRHGLAVRDFMMRRIVRLYPMFILGVGLAAGKAMAQIAGDVPNAMTSTQVVGVLMTEALMLPSPIGNGSLFPLNGPAWSLFLELLVNVAFAAWLTSMRSDWLKIVAILAGVVMCVAAWHANGLNVGWTWATWWGGVARVTFSFSVGVLIYRHGINSSGATALMIVPIVLLVAALVIDVAEAWRPLYDISVALVLSPLLLIAGASLQPSRLFHRACEFLGDLSYPVYALHAPLLPVAGLAVRALGLGSTLSMIVSVGGIGLFAWGVGRWVDPRGRRALAKVLAWGQALRRRSRDVS